MRVASGMTMQKETISRLFDLMARHGQGFTHFVVDTDVADSKVTGRSRIAMQPIAAGTLVAVIGGLLVSEKDEFMAMPIGGGLYLHQISDDHKATVNHSCDPNCRIEGFNRLVARREIAPGDEITIDYGSISVGKGSVIIDGCMCGSRDCRHVIRSDDYQRIPIEELGIFATEARNNGALT